jgi:hypothetical protein
MNSIGTRLPASNQENNNKNKKKEAMGKEEKGGKE